MSLDPPAPLPDPTANSRGERAALRRLAPGEPIGAYVVVEFVGGGGMGEVYRATQPSLRRDVAIKVIRSEWAGQRATRERFLAEQRIAGKLQHRHIVRAIDAGHSHAGPFLVMELVRGETMAATLSRQGPYDWSTACRLMRDVASGLQHIHDSGLLHRDLKPSNLIVDNEGTVKILDLGIAHPTWSERSTDTSAAHHEPSAWGSLDYLPPEAGQNATPLDARSDLYSLGCTLFEILVGRAPFAGAEYATTAAKLLAHWEQVPPPVGTLVDGVPQEVERLVARLLEKTPGARPESARTVLEQLDQILATPVEQLEFGRPGSRRLTRRALLATLAAITAPLGAGIVWRWREKPVARLTPPAEPAVAAVPRKPEAVELLGTFDLATCEVNGDWISTSRGLLSPPAKQKGRLQIPVLPRGEYDVQLRITPLETPSTLMLASVVGDALVADWMSLSEKKNGIGILANHTHDVVFQIRTSHILIFVDERLWEDWELSDESSMSEEFFPTPKSLYLDLYFRCRIESIRLVDLEESHQRQNGVELLSQPARLHEFAHYGPAIHDLAKVLGKHDGRLWSWEDARLPVDQSQFLMVAFQFGEPRWQNLAASDLEPLERLRGPIGLQLSFVKQISTALFASIARTSQLVYLRLRSTDITDDHLQLLAEHQGESLRFLFCDNAILTGAATPSLRAMRQLHTLSLIRTQFDDAIMEAVGELGFLRHLMLSGTATDANLRPLLGHPSLEFLYIQDAKKVTEASLDVIASLPRLRILKLFGCGIPESARARLESLGLLYLMFYPTMPTPTPSSAPTSSSSS